MSVAYYIVLDVEEPGFETFVNGKVLAKEEKRLDSISKQLCLPTIGDFTMMSAEYLSDLLGEEIEIPGHEEKWFLPAEGLVFVSALAEHIRANPKSVGNADAVLGELGEYESVLAQAERVGAKWHLNLDI